MSTDDPLPYSPIYIKAWTALSVLIGLVLLTMFAYNRPLLHAGHVVWDFLRWLSSPII